MILGILAKISRVGPERVYPVICSIVAVLSVFTIYTFTKFIIKDSRLCAISACFYIVYTCLAQPPLIKNFFEIIYTGFAGYPGEMLGFILYPVLVILLTKYILDGEKAYLYSSVLMAFPLITVHAQFFLYLAILIGALFLACLFKRPVKKYIGRFLSVSLPLILLSLLLYAVKHTSNIHLADHWFVVPFNDPYIVKHDYLVFNRHLYMLNIFNLLDKHRMIFIFSYASLFILLTPVLKKFVKTENLFMVSAVILAPLLLIYNPLLVPVLVKAITWVLPRRINYFNNEMLFYTLLFAFVALLFELLTLLLGRLYKKKILVVHESCTVVLVIILVLGLYGNKHVKDSFWSAVSSKENYLDITAIPNDSLYIFLNTKLPKESIVCSDYDTSYLVGAYTSHFVVSVDKARMGVPEAELDKRSADNIEIMKLSMQPAELRSYLTRYRVDFLVFNKKDKGYENWSRYDKIIHKIFENKDYVVFKVVS